MEKLLLTPTEAASALGIGRSKLYELMRCGDVTSVRIGGCRRVPAASLPALVARLQSVGTDQSGHVVAGRRSVVHPQIKARAVARPGRGATSSD